MASSIVSPSGSALSVRPVRRPAVPPSLLLASIPSHTETAWASASPLLSSAAVVCGIVKLALAAANRWFGGGVDRTTPAQSGVNVKRELEGPGWTSSRCRLATCALVVTTKASIPVIAEADAKPSRNEITIFLLTVYSEAPAAEYFWPLPSPLPPSALSGGAGMASYLSLWLRIAL